MSHMQKIFFIILSLLVIFTLPNLEHGRVTGYVTASRTAQSPKQIVNVLFLGNSYTFVNDLPKMMINIATSDKVTTTMFVVKSVTKPGAHLSDLWQDGEAQKIMHEHHWDYVVLQDQSMWVMSSQTINSGNDAAKKFAAEIKNIGAMPLIYMTWVRKPGSHWYTDQDTAFLKSPDYMHSQLHYYNYDLASHIGAMVIPVGEAWEKVMKEKPALELYQQDGSHPSEAGTYLAALLFYRYLGGWYTMDNATYHPANVTDSDAEYLKTLAKTQQF